MHYSPLFCWLFWINHENSKLLKSNWDELNLSANYDILFKSETIFYHSSKLNFGLKCQNKTSSRNSLIIKTCHWQIRFCHSSFCAVKHEKKSSFTKYTRRNVYVGNIDTTCKQIKYKELYHHNWLTDNSRLVNLHLSTCLSLINLIFNLNNKNSFLLYTNPH